MVLAMLLEERDGASIDLVESNRKKAAFLRTALAGNRIARVHARRIEDMARLLPVPEIVTARALAPRREPRPVGARALGCSQPACVERDRWRQPLAC